MKRSVFEKNFRAAVEMAVRFAKDYVFNDFPESMVFHVYPNQSYDGNPLEGDETVYPEDTIKNGSPLLMSTEKEAIEWLWRDEKVPEWIDINVEFEDGENTYLCLLSCGRFTATEEHLYHRTAGTPPFSVKSPIFPPGLTDNEDGDEIPKFDVNWRKQKTKR